VADCTVRIKLGQEGWLKQPVAKVVARTTSKEDLSWPVIRDHVRVTNVARHRSQEILVPEVWVHP
jgi:hypothetical protein